MINRPNLLAWLRQNLTSEPLCKLIVLKFFMKGIQADEVDQYEIRRGSSTKLLFDIDQLCDKIISTCEEQGEKVGGLVKFRLFAFAGEGQTRAKSTTVLKVFCPVEEESDNEHGTAVMSEEPGPRGQTAQIMRHHETMFRQYAGANADIYRTQRNEIESLRQDNKDLMGKYLTLVTTYETLQTQALQRKLMEEEALRKSQLFSSLVEKFAIFIPLLANKALGANVLPGAPNPEKEMLKAFLYSIKPEQFQTFMGVLDDAQRAPIIMLYEQLNKEEEEKKLAEAAKLSGAAPSPQLPQNNQQQAAAE